MLYTALIITYPEENCRTGEGREEGNNEQEWTSSSTGIKHTRTLQSGKEKQEEDGNAERCIKS